MRNFKSKKVIALLLSSILLISISACGKTSTENNQAASVATSQSTQAAVEAPDPFGKYDPPITLSTVKFTLPTYTYPEGDDINNNPYTREVESVLGIKLKNNWVIDQTEYRNKLSLSIAAGDIPDFFVIDSKQFVNLVNSGAAADLSDAYDKYASAEVKAYGESFKDGFDSAKFDGKLMGLPMLGFGTISLPSVLWIRQDWLTKLNLEAPKTVDDLAKVAEAFKNGIPGAYGMAVEKTLYGGVQNIIGFANAFHAYPTTWVKDSAGNISYGSTLPEMKTVLTTLQDYYNKGLIDKEFGVKDQNKTNEDVVNGKIGMMFGQNWLGWWPLTDAIKKDPTAVWRAYPIPTADGQPVKVSAPWPVGDFFVVNKECKNPEAVIKMANLYVKITNENKFPTSQVNNMDWKVFPVYYTDPMADYKKYEILSKAIDNKDPSGVPSSLIDSYNNAMTWVNDKNPDGLGAYLQASSEGSYSVLSKYVDSDSILLSELRGADPEEYAKKRATLEKIEADAFTKIIMGTSIEEFDKYVTQWKQLGGDEITKVINDIYNKK